MGIDPARGDMDGAFPPGRPPALHAALSWIVHPQTPEVVAVSNYLSLLWWLRRSRRDELMDDLFSQIRWVYLKKSRETLARHLSLPVNDQWCRTRPIQTAVLDFYEPFSKQFNGLADQLIDCDHLSIDETAESVRRIAEKSPKPSARADRPGDCAGTPMIFMNGVKPVLSTASS